MAISSLNGEVEGEIVLMVIITILD